MLSVAMIDLIYAIPFPDWISPNIFSIGKLSIRWYGISFILGITLAYFWTKRACAKTEYWRPEGITRGTELIPSKRMLEDLFFYCLLGIIVGGRIGSIILYSPEMITQDPIGILKVWEGGMAFHGGFLGVCAAIIFVVKRNKLSLWRIADVVAIGAPLGILMVRILGNFVNQELYGRVTDVPWAFIFNSDPTSLPRHPSQLYEAGLEGVAIFLLLWLAISKFRALTKPGICAGAFIFLYGIFRIFVEFFREPDAALFGPLTRGMTYSLPMVIIGAAIVLWALKRSPVAPKRISDPEKA